LTDACAVPASALPADSVVIVQTGNDWQWVHYTLPTDSNVVTIASVAGKTVQGIFRDDMPQQLVVSAPGVDKEYTFVAATGTFTWNASNVLFAGTVITVICK
jgi:hypothetical protein